MNEREKRLVMAAHTVFGRYGVSKTTMNDIAKEAGVARQTLYNAYPSKEAILRAAVRYVDDQSVSALEAAWAGQEDLADKLEQYFQSCPLAWYDMIAASPEAADLIDGIHVIAKDVMDDAAIAWKARFTDLVRRHAAPGSAAMADPDAAGDFIYWSSVNAKTGAVDRAQVVARLALLKTAILAMCAG